MRRSKARGFTYLWVLLLVALLGLGLTVAAEVHTTLIRQDKEKELLAIGREFREALRRFREAPGGGQVAGYPSSLDELIHDERRGVVLRHLRRIYVDPMTGQPQWGEVRVGGRIVGIHSLSTEVPLKKEGFELEYQHFRNAKSYGDWVFSAQ